MLHELFNRLKDVNLFTLEVHMLAYIAEHAKTYRDVAHLDAAPSKLFNCLFKKVLKMTSLCNQTTIEEAITLMNFTFSNTEKTSSVYLG